jgi:hypothetical protein
VILEFELRACTCQAGPLSLDPYPLPHTHTVLFLFRDFFQIGSLIYAPSNLGIVRNIIKMNLKQGFPMRWNSGLNSELYTCNAGFLLLESHLQPSKNSASKIKALLQLRLFFR